MKQGCDESQRITILTCSPGYVAAKSHRLNSQGKLHTTSHKSGKYFRCEERQAKDIFELHKLLSVIGDAGNKLIIRGRLNPDALPRSDGRVRRASRPKASESEEVPWFLEQLRCWVLIDVDKVENPEG